MTTLVGLKSVDAGYPGQPVLKDVSLTVHSAECVAVIGPNGSGKSTLLKCLARQLKPTRGTVHIESLDAWSQSPGWAAQRIAITTREPEGEWPMTVEESVSLGRTPHRGWIRPLTHGDHAVVERELERTGLTTLRNRRIDRLSDGERQRVTLARALAQQPKVLLLDEPTANLDLKYQLEILMLARSMAKTGLAVVAAIHDLTLAAKWADRVVVLKDGRMLAEGPMRDVMTAETIQSAFGVRVSVLNDPAYCTPVIVPLEVAS